jgi:hypothetical protein
MYCKGGVKSLTNKPKITELSWNHVELNFYRLNVTLFKTTTSTSNTGLVYSGQVGIIAFQQSISQD